jgi:aminomethyltransferase
MDRGKENQIKQTVVHAWHLANGANMAAFASYDMPLWYPSGTKNEHLAVLTGAGLFDTSHMATLVIGGKTARNLLQRCFSKDLDTCLGSQREPLVAGRCVYGVFLDEYGQVLDDSIVYQIGEELYLVVVNAGMGGCIASHLHQSRGELDPDIIDLTDRVGKMDIQGPASAKILKKIIRDPDKVFAGMVYFSFKGWFAENNSAVSRVQLLDGTQVMVSRTGYTGEFGFELYIDVSKTMALWEMVLAAGSEFNMIPCGLAARDSLRTGAVLPLSHQDIGHWPFVYNPWLFALPWDKEGTGFSKHFVGAEALLQSNDHNHTLPFAGYDPRKINAGDNSFVTNLKGERIGTILTCTTDMALDRRGKTIISIATPQSSGRPADFTARGLCCGFIRVAKELMFGEEVILTDGKRKIPVEIRRDIRPDRSARSKIANML